MITIRKFATTAAAAVALLAVPAQAQEAVEQGSATVAVETDAAEVAGPALWKVADEDTTIYLFGTVHALPENIEWYKGPIATALGQAQSLVTEIPKSAMEGPEAQQFIMGKAMLPMDENLRDMLNDEQKESYEAAMTSIGLPVAAFDRFEPWFAGITLSILPLMKSGYSPESGVENVIEENAGEEVERAALETLEMQIGVFDEMPLESQIAFLIATADNVDDIAGMMDEMVAEWVEGDAAGLAELMNKSLTDPVLAERLLFGRNRNWAEWIDTRLDEPGTVFIAVGAGHLAGDNSVQEYLDEKGIVTTRIQ